MGWLLHYRSNEIIVSCFVFLPLVSHDSRFATDGVVLGFQIDSRNPNSPAGAAEGAAALPGGLLGTTVGIHFLYSYKDAGVGLITCASGCTCDATEMKVDTNWRYHISINNWVFLGVSQHNECVLNITNAGESRAGEPKLKINALSVLPFDVQHRMKFATSIVEEMPDK